jgi:hypothetical protein
MPQSPRGDARDALRNSHPEAPRETCPEEIVTPLAGKNSQTPQAARTRGARKYIFARRRSAHSEPRAELSLDIAPPGPY